MLSPLVHHICTTAIRPLSARTAAKPCGPRWDRTIRRSSNSPRNSALPLDGVRVLELGQLIAGPFAGQLLGNVLIFTAPHTQLTSLRQFGAEVIKVEPPKKGDPLRVWRELDTDGCSPWFRSIGRNKKSVAVDLHTEQVLAHGDAHVTSERTWRLCHMICMYG
ncbi:L-carnitine dehydratase bile acid-inducible protein f [Mycena indigotica]|uniref:L-carnitine dehydratase bile acid-inducible protein f n=1 Tax=Mycena indigotica TaxID=2126181 RepID=A0A8H6SSD1_9AGAR|nr:L-carnitine dehydratase bile acid-inducible protein f [Mycena indigotica]KAF7303507.1 L-carnitine dehydratase bile acid-inducible protein f [Mycena indigotica]